MKPNPTALAALLLARDPYVEKADGFFLDWLLRNTPASGEHVPLTVVEIGVAPVNETQPTQDSRRDSTAPHGDAGAVSPLEFALFFQAILDFKPTIVAVEPLLKWHERDRDQEQVFLDQAMRVPKLLLSAELTSTPDPDAPPTEIPGFVHVSGRRGDLPTYTGVQRQPDEDLRLVSLLGYINLSGESTTRVPLLFNYRGEVIPAFALQAFLTWARIPMSEAQIQIGSHIALPGGRKIPIDWDGSLTVNPNASKLGRRFSLNELLLLAQQRQQNSPLQSLHDELILARTPTNPLAPPDVFAATIATLQSNRFTRRVSVVFDCAVILLIAFLGSQAVRASRVDLVLGLIAFTAAYCLIAFMIISRYAIWVPGLVPLGTAWLLGILAFAWPRPKHRAEATEIAASPPAP